MTTQGPTELVERLREGCSCRRCKLDACCCLPMEEAAATIESQQRLIERMREALGRIDEWCCPLLCANCRDNRKTAKSALTPSKENGDGHGEAETPKPHRGEPNA